MNTAKFQELLARANSVLVVLPKDPTFDNIAAGLSLHLSLSSLGKKTNIFCSTPMLVEFNRLVGVDQVSNEIGNKNLILTLRDYPANDIERVSYNIENGEMQLTIIPKPGVTPPNTDQIIYAYGGLATDMVVLLGVHSDDQLGPVELQEEINKNPNSVLILQEYAPQIMPRRRGIVELIDAQASSLCEMIGVLLTETSLPLDQDIASNLLSGITTATQNYTVPRVRPETFELSAKLLRASGQVNISNTTQVLSQDKKAPQEWLEPKVFKGNTMP